MVAEGRRLWTTTKNGRWWVDSLTNGRPREVTSPWLDTKASQLTGPVCRSLEKKLLIRPYSSDEHEQVVIYTLTMDGIKAVPTERKDLDG